MLHNYILKADLGSTTAMRAYESLNRIIFDIATRVPLVSSMIKKALVVRGRHQSMICDSESDHVTTLTDPWAPHPSVPSPRVQGEGKPGSTSRAKELRFKS